MPANLPTLQELPSVRSALKWLLSPNRNATDRTVLIHARLCRLIHVERGGHWRADGALVTRLAKMALRRLPRDPHELGDVLHGLGEIAARSHIALEEPLIRSLRLLGRRVALEKILGAAFARDAKLRHPVQFNTIAMAQWLSRADFSWGTFDEAVNRLEHGDGLHDGRYGLTFSVRIVLALDPRVIDHWIKSHPNQPGLAAIGSAAIWMALPFDGEAMIAPLLRSRNAAICCIGAAAVVFPPGLREPPSFQDCMQRLGEGGIEASDTVWMTGMWIKRAVHERNWLEDRGKGEVARLRYVEQNPQAAVGGPHNADAEVSMLRARTEHGAQRHESVFVEIEKMLSDLAHAWPREGLSEGQMAALENIFAGTAEMRHRLAEKLSHQASRNSLLKKNIDQLKEFIGLKMEPGEISIEHFDPDERTFDALSTWAARSLILLYADDKRGAGKRTSDLVKGVADAATALVVQPFIAGRKPQAWQAIMARAACAGRFAFTVVDNMPEGERDKVAGLNELALSFAFTLLTARSTPNDTLYFALTAQSVQQMGHLPIPDAKREAWGLAEDLPDFARALALWSSPPLVSKHEVLASELFRRVATLPLSSRGQTLQMCQMLSLLDLATASSASPEREHLLSVIAALWKGAYQDWEPIAPRWAAIAEMLGKAVLTDGPERAQLRADPSFAHSYCRRLIDRPAGTDDRAT